MDTKTLGQRIKARRKELGLTARELAAKVKVVPTYISKLESKNILPAPAIIVHISEVLKEDFITDYMKEKNPELFKFFQAALTRKINMASTHNKKSHK